MICLLISLSTCDVLQNSFESFKAYYFSPALDGMGLKLSL